jgi:hypothetical protein
VEITFTDRAGGTLVVIEHRGWDRVGALGPDWREVNKSGWSTPAAALHRRCLDPVSGGHVFPVPYPVAAAIVRFIIRC